MFGNTHEQMLDTVCGKDCNSGWEIAKKGQTALIYSEEEVDPLRSFSGKEMVHVCRGGDSGNGHKRQGGASYRLCVGPDPKLLNIYPKK
jgi:hypothetical protein